MSLLKSWSLAAAVLLGCLAAHAAGPAAGADGDLKQFIPAGKRVVSRLDADFTGDGVPDTVLVSAGDNFDVTVTALTRLQGKSVDGKGRMEGLQAIDSLDLELTPHGPPKVSVKNGVLIVESITGGNSVSTVATYRYRLDAEEGRMRLIGLDAERTSSTIAVRLSWNVLTGTRLVRWGRRDPQAFTYEPEIRSNSSPEKIHMSSTPNPEDLLDKLVRARRKP
jgi:hypothetical protein